MDLNRDRPPILTPRGFDRWLAAMVVLAFAVHLIILAITVLVGEFRLRPDAETEAYTVEMIDGGELGGHMPAGLPAVDLGPPPGRRAPAAKAAPKPPAPEPPPPEPPKVVAAPPEPPAKPEPPPAEPAKPEVVAQAEPPDDGEKLIVPATPTPTPRPSPRPTASATPIPKPSATPRPAVPTATPTRRPLPSPTSTPRPSPRPSASAAPAAKPVPTKTPFATPRPSASAAKPPATAPGATPTPSAREAQIADALSRVQQRVEETRRATSEPPTPPAERGATGSATAPGARSAEQGRTAGVGGTDAPDPRRGIGIGPGAGGAGKVRGLEFLLYYNEMISRIRTAWAWAGDKPNLVVKVRFRILDDGTVAELRVTEPSGDGSYDASVLRAVRATSPLAPPPAMYRKDFTDVELTFQPSDLKQTP